MYKRIGEIMRDYESFVGKDIEVRGWIQTVRKQAENTFIMIQDGSNADPLQLYIETDKLIIKEPLVVGCAVRGNGKLVRSPAKGQLVELALTSLIVEGSVDVSSYPIAKTNVSLEYLRGVAHLRARTKTFQAIYRIRHTMMMAIHDFFGKQKEFLLLDPNIITTSECEGGAGVFQVSELDIYNTQFLHWKVIESQQMQSMYQLEQS